MADSAPPTVSPAASKSQPWSRYARVRWSMLAVQHRTATIAAIAAADMTTVERARRRVAGWTPPPADARPTMAADDPPATRARRLGRTDRSGRDRPTRAARRHPARSVTAPRATPIATAPSTSTRPSNHAWRAGSAIRAKPTRTAGDATAAMTGDAATPMTTAPRTGSAMATTRSRRVTPMAASTSVATAWARSTL